jgi:2-polyprenyl-3-methyl-5-hydroxy-6-metoxy-1,4-benzoquinol methylase
MTDTTASTDIDPERLGLYSLQLFTTLQGAVTAGMVHLGDRLGLYAAMRGADRPVTSRELADATDLHERWVREWAYNQAAAKLIVATGDEPVRFSLTPEAAAVLATPEHPSYGMGMFHRLPQTMRALEDMPESFRTGVGYDYDSHGREGAVGIERSFEPWNRAHLLPTVLPALDGVIDRLREGISVADVGCGAGSALLLMAAEFPASRFTGYDISEHALARANEKLATSGLTIATFADPRSTPLPSDHSLGLITTFDCIHDMTHPQQIMESLRAAIADDGTWLLVDIKALDTFAANAAKNPMAALMYGVSVLSCMSSALSEPDGAGLGTLGLSENRARAMAERAGFTRFRRLAIDNPMNAFYEVRP